MFSSFLASQFLTLQLGSSYTLDIFFFLSLWDCLWELSMLNVSTAKEPTQQASYLLRLNLRSS